MNDFRSLIALNISLGVAWGASLVPTWRTILSGFFLKCGIIKNLISPMVAPWNVRTFIVFRLDILNPLRPDRIESPIIRVVPFFHGWIDCCLDFLSNLQHPSWKQLVQDSVLHLRYSGNYVGTLALHLWDLLIVNTVVYIVQFWVQVSVVVCGSIGCRLNSKCFINIGWSETIW